MKPNLANHIHEPFNFNHQILQQNQTTTNVIATSRRVQQQPMLPIGTSQNHLPIFNFKRVFENLQWGLRLGNLQPCNLQFSNYDGLEENSNEEEIFFYCCGEKFSLWQSFLLSMQSIVTCCVKVAQLVQSLATTLLTYSFNHPFPIPNVEVISQPTQVSLCLKLKLAI